MDSSTRRYGVPGAILAGYVAILGYGVVTGTATMAVIDIYVGVVLVGASAARYAERGTPDVSTAEMAAFVVGGVAIGYEGLSMFSVVPPVSGIDILGNVVLMAALLLLVYRLEIVSGRSDIAE